MLKLWRCASHVRFRQSGFTLIELMVVIAIVAVMATLAAPNFSQFIATFRVRSSAEGIINGLNFARRGRPA